MFRKRSLLALKVLLGLGAAGGAAYLLVQEVYLDAAADFPGRLPPLEVEMQTAETDLAARLADANVLLPPDELERLILFVEPRKQRAHQVRQTQPSHEPGRAACVLLSAQRSSTIAKAVLASMWDYRRTLKVKCTRDEHEQRALSACHTRSATRVLHTLQKNGDICIKLNIMQPDVERFSAIDMSTVNRLTRLVRRAFPMFEFSWLAEEMNQNPPFLEMDFAHEAGNAEHARQDSAHYTSTSVYIPQLYFASTRVMIMEFIHGHRPGDLLLLRDNHINLKHVSQEPSKAFAQMLYIHGFFHADPHAGNALVRFVPRNSPLSRSSRPPFNFELVLGESGDPLLSSISRAGAR